jgi:hypothetical protein
VGQDRQADVRGSVAGGCQPRDQGVGGPDLEARQAVVQKPDKPTGEVVGVGDRRPVLTGIEED